ncbi:MAG TPA: hypothetical protein DEH78_05640 [Solibacterales bacterium]|nr:hypothetical protein [Bryobacterales bacterium]
MNAKVRSVGFVLLGAAGLLLRGRYDGPGQPLVRSYGGNVSVSFAVYFIFCHLFPPARAGRLIAAGLALAVVELFELTNGFGVMQNTYDPFDLLANAAGIALAIAVDSIRPA